MRKLFFVLMTLLTLSMVMVSCDNNEPNVPENDVDPCPPENTIVIVVPQYADGEN